MEARPPSKGAHGALDAFAAELDATFSAASKVEDVSLPVARTLPGQWTAVSMCPPADPKTLICALGPCRHYTTHVRYLPTSNEAADGLARTHREHRCRLLDLELQDEYVFACSSWSPAWWRRFWLRVTRQRPSDIVTTATPERLAPPRGLRPCPICHLSLECSGVLDVSAREALNSNIGAWCWCGHRSKQPTTWEDARG